MYLVGILLLILLLILGRGHPAAAGGHGSGGGWRHHPPGHLGGRLPELLPLDAGVDDLGDEREDVEESGEHGQPVGPRQVVEFVVRHPAVVVFSLHAEQDHDGAHQDRCKYTNKTQN